MTTSSRQLGCAGSSPTSPTDRFADGAPFRMFPRGFARGGDNAIVATIRQMNALVYGRGGVRSPMIRQAALEAVKGVERGQSEIESAFNWVKERIEFRGEHAETLQEPRVTLQLGAGDCDDHAMLLGAIYASLGYRVRFRTVATPSAPDEFSHVFAEVEDKKTGQWIPVDTTVDQSYAGWQPPNTTRSQSYRILGQQEQMSMGYVLAWIGAALAADWLSKRVKF